MISRWIRAVGMLAALAPAAASAFETVDTLPFPSEGGFPAWPADTVGPWTVFANAGAMYDSNAFRRSTGEQSDVVARVGVGARSLTRVFGRQRLLLEGIGEYYDYDRFSEVDHFAYGLRGDWLWQLGNQLDGVVGYSRSRRHADLGEFRTERRTMVSSDRVVADGGYRFAPDWRLSAGAEHTRSRRDDDDIDELSTSTARGGLAYRTPLGNEIGAELRTTSGEARVLQGPLGDEFSVADDYKERELAGTLSYGLGAQLRIGARLGHTEREYENFSERDFSGTTYRGRVDWLPTTKLILTLEAYRLPETVIEADATHVVRRGAAFGASWAASFKLVFTARFVNERRTYQGDAGAALVGLGQRDDTLRIWRFGAGWEPQRHWQLGAALDIGERTSNLIGRDYDYTQVMLNAQFSF